MVDKGIPTAGLLAHVMVAKFADHLPLYRQEKIPAMGTWALELVACRVAAQRQTGGGDHELDPVGAAQRA